MCILNSLFCKVSISSSDSFSFRPIMYATSTLTFHLLKRSPLKHTISRGKHTSTDNVCILFYARLYTLYQPYFFPFILVTFVTKNGILKKKKRPTKTFSWSELPADICFYYSFSPKSRDTVHSVHKFLILRQSRLHSSTKKVTKSYRIWHEP